MWVCVLCVYGCVRVYCKDVGCKHDRLFDGTFIIGMCMHVLCVCVFCGCVFTAKTLDASLAGFLMAPS